MAADICDKEGQTLKIARAGRNGHRVLVVDRDPMTSQLLADALLRDMRCDAAAVSSNDLLRILAAEGKSLVVISSDLSWQSGNGLDLADAVCRAYKEAKIIILSNETTKELVIDAFRVGARGVCGRRQIPEFLDCVERVSKGFIWAGKEETTYLLEGFRNIPAPRVSTTSNCVPLTTRELQVVQCAARGKSNKSIASELCLSEHTVKNYLFRAFDKLGVSSRIELLFYLSIKGHAPMAVAPDDRAQMPLSGLARG